MPLVLGTGGAEAPAEVLAAGTGMTATDCSGYSIVPVSSGCVAITFHEVKMTMMEF